jgi:large subunit ribosomal protein L17
MNHRVKAKHFNRDTSSRKALLKNLLRDLFEHGEIKTSESRVKEVKRLADKVISTASKNTLSARRDLHKFFGRRDVVNALVDKIAPMFGDKKSGFTTSEKLAARRGDNTMLFKLSLLTGDKKITSLKKEKTVETKIVAKTKITTKKPEVKKAETKKIEVKQAPAKKAVVKKLAVKKVSVSKAKKSEEKK